MRKILIAAAVLAFCLSQAAFGLAQDLFINLPGGRVSYPLPAGKTVTITLKVGITNPGTTFYFFTPTKEAVGGKLTRTKADNLVLSGSLCQTTVNMLNTDKFKLECNYNITDTSKDASFAYRNDSNGIVLISVN